MKYLIIKSVETKNLDLLKNILVPSSKIPNYENKNLTAAGVSVKQEPNPIDGNAESVLKELGLLDDIFEDSDGEFEGFDEEELIKYEKKDLPTRDEYANKIAGNSKPKVE